MRGEWQETTIGAAFEVNPSRPLKRGSVAPFIPMDALPVNARIPERVDSREFTGSGARFKNGDTLLARITPCLENGKTAFISQLLDEVTGHGSTEYIVISGNDGISDGLFGYYLARSPEFRSYAISHMEGTSGRQRVPSSAVETYELILPPLPEQRAIAHILGTLDDKIELNRKQNQTLETIARALFKAWFVDFEPCAPRWKAAGSVVSPFPACPRICTIFFPTGWLNQSWGRFRRGGKWPLLMSSLMSRWDSRHQEIPTTKPVKGSLFTKGAQILNSVSRKDAFIARRRRGWQKTETPSLAFELPSVTSTWH